MKLRFPPVLLSLALLPLLAPLRAATAAPPSPNLNVTLENNSVKNFGAAPVLIVPTVYLYLPVAGKIFVAKQASALSGLGRRGNGNSVKAKARYVVTGLDKEFAQGLAKKLYDDFVARLRAAGYTVKTYEDIAGLEQMKQTERETPDAALGLPTLKIGEAVCLITTPSDAQCWKSGLAGGIFNQFMHFGKSGFEGTLVIPSYYIACPQAWGEKGSTYSSISAEIHVLPGMTLTAANVQAITAKGTGAISQTKTALTSLTDKAGELKKVDTTSHAGNALSKSLSLVGGSGSITSSSGNYELAIDHPAYESALLSGALAFNAEVTKVIAAQRK